MASDIASFIVWLRYAPVDHRLDPVVVAGPGSAQVRQARRINRVLSAVRLFMPSAATYKDVAPGMLGHLYEIGDMRDLPLEQVEEGDLLFRMEARHYLAEDRTAVDRATDVEVVAMLRGCRSARDRLIVLMLARVDLRRGEVTGLRLEDLHFLADSLELGFSRGNPGRSPLRLLHRAVRSPDHTVAATRGRRGSRAVRALIASARVYRNGRRGGPLYRMRTGPRLG